MTRQGEHRLLEDLDISYSRNAEFLYRNLTTLAMKCVHCGRELAFSPRTDGASGQQVDVYRCIKCGIEMREYRPKEQIGR